MDRQDRLCDSLQHRSGFKDECWKGDTGEIGPRPQLRDDVRKDSRCRSVPLSFKLSATLTIALVGLDGGLIVHRSLSLRLIDR